MKNTNRYDDQGFRRYTRKSEFDKSIHVLDGLLHGVAIDDIINKTELDELKKWIETHREFINMNPFKELIPVLEKAIEDNILEKSEKADILWMCKNFTTQNHFYDIVTSDLQRLHGILHGILSDNVISDEEVRRLDLWIDENEHIIGFYPYDEIKSILLTVLSNRVITDDEREIMLLCFSDFIEVDSNSNIDHDKIRSLKEHIKLGGIFTSEPKITFKDKNFCVTGKFTSLTRDEVHQLIQKYNGNVSKDVSHKTDYLIVGSDGSKSWTFSCYGRKIEQAMSLRREGGMISIIHEVDFKEIVEEL